jgi:WD40 repeat protein
MEVLRALASIEPITPRRLRPRLPRDLETIALKAIEKDPARRYASGGALAEDLRRFLDGLPIRARPPTARVRLVKWARRRPVVAALGAMLTVVLIATTLGLLAVAGRMAALARSRQQAAEQARLSADSERAAKLAAQAAQAQAEAARREAEAQRERAERHLYSARIGQAEGALRLSDSATARTLLDQCRPGPGAPDRRGWEWAYLDQWCRPELTTLNLPAGVDAQAVDVSPDGRLLAVGCSRPYAYETGEDPSVPALLIGLPDGRVRHELAGHREYVHAVTFRPDGQRLATLGAEGMIRVWDTGSGRELRAIDLTRAVRRPPSPTSAGLRWGPDGRRLASAWWDGLVRIWDPATGQELTRVVHGAGAVAWSPDGTLVATAGGYGQGIRIWDARDGRRRGPDIEHLGENRSLAWSPDGRRLAAIAWDLGVWDAESGRRVLAITPVGELRSVAFSPDGLRLAIGGTEGVVRVLDAATGRERVALFTGGTKVTNLAFHPDGRRLFAAGWKMGGVKVFDPDRDPRGRGFDQWLRQLAALTFGDGGLRIVGIAWDSRHLVSLDPTEGGVRLTRRLAVTGAPGWPRGDFAFSPEGRRLAAPTSQDPAVVGVWEVALGRRPALLRGSAGAVTAVAFGPDGTSLATAADGGPRGSPVVILWDLGSRRPPRTISAGPIRVEALAFSGDGRRLAAGGGGRGAPGWVTVWDPRSGATLATFGHHLGAVKSLAFHPDGDPLAVADFAQSKVHLWDVSAGTVITKSGPGSISCVAFTPDGQRLAALGYDGNVHLADARTGDEVLVLRGFGPPPGSAGFTPRLAFSPDGSRLAGHALGDLLNLWDSGPAAAAAVEPGPGDLAGWLRRSRALAGTGDDAGAAAAFERARALATEDPGPWIEHALSRHVDTRQAEAALSRALASPCDDPLRWLGYARLLKGAGRPEAAAPALARARSLAERRLADAPDDEPAAWVVADLLKDEVPPHPAWTRLTPSRMTSDGGAELTLLPDGSILAGGPSPEEDTYTIVAPTGLARITGLRLEVLPDPRLPGGGPGRHPDSGDFHLTEIDLAVAPRGADPARATPVAFAGVASEADSQHAPREAIDHDHATCWNVWPNCGRANALVLATASPVGAPGGSTLVVRLDFRASSLRLRTLGRFRLWATTRPMPWLDAALRKVLADPEEDGRTRLAAARLIQSDGPAAAAVLRSSAEEPESSATDRFLLAMALHHLGRRDEARRWVDLGEQRLGPIPADHALRALATEATAAVRGLSRSEAEALILDDPVFPADPFVH